MSEPQASRADAAAEAEQAIAGILAAMRQAQRGVVVDSPPGAGKSTLVVRVALDLVHAGERVIVIAQTNDQVDDLTDALAVRAQAAMKVAVGRLTSASHVIPQRVLRHENVAAATTLADLDGCPVILSTAAKWATIKLPGDEPWPWAIVDEAYQMRSDLLLRVAGLFEKALFVGDPGQLDPFSSVETDRFAGLPWDPMQSAVAVLLANNDGIIPLRLPLSWRLPASAAPVISTAFYPFSPFRAATAEGDRGMTWGAVSFGKSGVDVALETAARDGWALYELPAGHMPRTDREAVRACAALVERLLQRGPVVSSEGFSGPVPPNRIAVGVAHRDQAKAIRQELAERGVPVDGVAPAGAPGVVVDTANRLQGREFEVTVVLHPLSGRRDATEFHLEAGRLCVLLSRHRHACIVVARAGIAELLDAHPSVVPVHLNVAVKFPDGWEAQQVVLTHLSDYRVPAD